MKMTLTRVIDCDSCHSVKKRDSIRVTIILNVTRVESESLNIVTRVTLSLLAGKSFAK